MLSFSFCLFCYHLWGVKMFVVRWLYLLQKLRNITYLSRCVVCSTPPTRSEAFEDFKRDAGSEIHRILTENKGKTTPEELHRLYEQNMRLSPPSRGRPYNCASYHSMQCLNASSERYLWRFYSFIGYAEWYPLACPPEVCQSFKEVLSTLRSVGDAHWARAVASALGVCLVQASAPQVRSGKGAKCAKEQRRTLQSLLPQTNVQSPVGFLSVSILFENAFYITRISACR